MLRLHRCYLSCSIFREIQFDTRAKKEAIIQSHLSVPHAKKEKSPIAN